MKKSKHGQSVRFIRRFDCYHYKGCLSEHARKNKIRNFCRNCNRYQRTEFRVGGWVTEEMFAGYYALLHTVFESANDPTLQNSSGRSTRGQ